jgi:hypothetical protein
MFGYREIETLKNRKEELLAQSAVNRHLLAVESQSFKARLAWVDIGIGWARKTRPAWIIAAPLLGFWVARKAASGSRLWRKLAFWWPLLRQAKTILKRFQTGLRMSE